MPIFPLSFWCSTIERYLGSEQKANLSVLSGIFETMINKKENFSCEQIFVENYSKSKVNFTSTIDDENSPKQKVYVEEIPAEPTLAAQFDRLD